MRGISSRARARCSGAVAPTTAPTSCRPLAGPGSPSPSTSRATRSHTRSPPSVAQVLDVGRARVRRPHEHEEARPGRAQRAQRVDAHVRAGREGVGADAGRRRRRASESRRPAPARRRRRRRRCRRAWRRRGRAGPAACACSTTSSSTRQPCAPRRSKQASCGLTATQAGPAASMAAAQCAATATAARSAGDPSAGAAASACGHRRAGSGSSPRTTWDSRSATRASSRSAKCGPAGARRCCVSPAFSA